MGRRETDLKRKIYAEWQRIINYELPTMFLSYGVTVAAVNERVQGINTEPGPLALWVACRDSVRSGSKTNCRLGLTGAAAQHRLRPS